jgi:hypothetical protein
MTVELIMPFKITPSKSGFRVVNAKTGHLYARNTRNPMGLIHAVELNRALSTHPKLNARRKREKWVNLTARLTDPGKIYPCERRGPRQNELKLPTLCRPTRSDRVTTSKEITVAMIRKALKAKIQHPEKSINWRALAGKGRV